MCSAGAGDCPPEDCGGPIGYQDLLDDAADTVWEAQDDLLLVAERLLAWSDGGPRPTEEDHDFMDALDRMNDRIYAAPTPFDRRAVNRALRTLQKE